MLLFYLKMQAADWPNYGRMYSAKTPDFNARVSWATAEGQVVVKSYFKASKQTDLKITSPLFPGKSLAARHRSEETPGSTPRHPTSSNSEDYIFTAVWVSIPLYFHSRKRESNFLKHKTNRIRRYDCSGIMLFFSAESSIYFKFASWCPLE